MTSPLSSAHYHWNGWHPNHRQEEEMPRYKARHTTKANTPALISSGVFGMASNVASNQSLLNAALQSRYGLDPTRGMS